MTKANRKLKSHIKNEEISGKEGEYMARRRQRRDDEFNIDPLTAAGSDPLSQSGSPDQQNHQQKPPTGCLVSILVVFFVIVVFCLFMFFSL